jgi:Flp pilus assembly protein TadG
MKASSIEFKLLRNQRGVSAVIIALLLVVLLGMAALAVDLGYLYVTRNELQNVADAAALAATRRLGEIYQAMPGNLQADYDLSNFPTDRTDMENIAIEVAGMNKAAAAGITILNADIEFGQWDFVNRSLTVTDDQPDAVRVKARKDETANNPVTTFFAKVFNVNTMAVTATATAALSGQGETEEGELILPIGISYAWFTGGAWCDETIKFSPTKDPDACAGWNSFTFDPPNDAILRKILEGNPNYTSPPTTAGETVFNFIGGDLSQNTFEQLLQLYRDKGFDIVAGTGSPPNGDGTFEPAATVDGSPVTGALQEGEGLEKTGTMYDDKTGEPIYYPDDKAQAMEPRKEHVWYTHVVVYDWPDCSNPNTAIKIVGYAPIRMETVLDAGNDGKTVVGQVTCDQFSKDDTRGGGLYTGIKGSIPGLVE